MSLTRQFLTRLPLLSNVCVLLFPSPITSLCRRRIPCWVKWSQIHTRGLAIHDKLGNCFATARRPGDPPAKNQRTSMRRCRRQSINLDFWKISKLPNFFLPAVVPRVDICSFVIRNRTHVREGIWRTRPHTSLNSFQLPILLIAGGHLQKRFGSCFHTGRVCLADFSKGSYFEIILRHIVRAADAANIDGPVWTWVHLH